MTRASMVRRLAWTPHKVSRVYARRRSAVFVQSEACSAAPYCLVRPESHKDGAAPYKTVERRALQRYAVAHDLLWCSMDTGSNGRVQCRARRQYAVYYYVGLQKSTGTSEA